MPFVPSPYDDDLAEQLRQQQLRQERLRQQHLAGDFSYRPSGFDHTAPPLLQPGRGQYPSLTPMTEPSRDTGTADPYADYRARIGNPNWHPPQPSADWRSRREAAAGRRGDFSYRPPGFDATAPPLLQPGRGQYPSLTPMADLQSYGAGFTFPKPY